MQLEVNWQRQMPRWRQSLRHTRRKNTLPVRWKRRIADTDAQAQRRTSSRTCDRPGCHFRISRSVSFRPKTGLYRANYSSNVLASMRLAVSKPSVNQL